jgi:DNA-binding beta-propeller fold protein YncE
MRQGLLTFSALSLLTLSVPAYAAPASIIISMNDNHTVMDANANQLAPPNPKPDNADVIDVSAFPPRVIASFNVPGSIIGPPQAVWVSKDASWGILTSSAKYDPKVHFGVGPDNRVSVVDLTTTPPTIVQSLTAGSGATTVRVSPDGTLALVCNRNDGTISIFTVANKRLTPAGSVGFGKSSSPSAVGFLPDGRTALVSLKGPNEVAVLHIQGTQITVDPRPITTGVSPFTLDINAAGTLAAVGNVGRGNGDMDTVALVELTQMPPRVVDIVGVPTGPEPLAFSPTGKYLAVGSQEGSFSPTTSPFFHDHGHLQIFRVDNGKLLHVDSARIGRWSEGVAWSRDGKTVMVGNFYEHTISVFRFNGEKLTPEAPLIPTGGPVAFGTPWP